MIEEYISDTEYETYYGKLGSLRAKIAGGLPVEPGMHILEVGSGEGFFGIEVAKRDSSLRITSIDISLRAIGNSRENVRREGLADRVEILEMDATKMTFSDHEFDLAVNFAGLEDIHMTRGMPGVQKTFLEVNRVLKPGSCFCFLVMPPEEMETEAQKTEVALYSYICGATWLTVKEYRQMLEHAGFKFMGTSSHTTGKKLTPDQAKAEIQFACENVPQIYGINTRSFEEIWAKFGQAIERNGLGCHSKVMLMITRKPEGAE